jgi:hypothetical protein
MAETITRETKREDQRKAKRCTAHMSPKKEKGRELESITSCAHANYM